MRETGSLEDSVAVTVFENVVTRQNRKRQWRDFVRGFNMGFESGRENPPRYSELASVQEDFQEWNDSFETISNRDGDPIPPVVRKRACIERKPTKKVLEAISALKILKRGSDKTPPRKLRPRMPNSTVGRNV
jgi:hypothetical protein